MFAIECLSESSVCQVARLQEGRSTACSWSTYYYTMASNHLIYCISNAGRKDNILWQEEWKDDNKDYDDDGDEQELFYVDGDQQFLILILILNLLVPN